MSDTRSDSINTIGWPSPYNSVSDVRLNGIYKVEVSNIFVVMICYPLLQTLAHYVMTIPLAELFCKA